MTAEYVMGLMRRNKDTLLAFLDIFVQDPITDTIWYKNAGDIFGSLTAEELDVKGGMFKRAILRVNDKLNGKEFERVMDEKQQVARLIDLATSKLNLAQMYYGWAPFW
jgi:phosphatidylinositol kinase/protein kinase (PI-3  family)